MGRKDVAKGSVHSHVPTTTHSGYPVIGSKVSIASYMHGWNHMLEGLMTNLSTFLMVCHVTTSCRFIKAVSCGRAVKTPQDKTPQDKMSQT